MEILIPISLGELYDKLTILEIKSEKIEDVDKLKNINKEINLLKKIVHQYPIATPYWADLYNVNSILWEIEDSIRKKESIKLYDEEFIELARRVYIYNDRRSKIKKEINTEYGSDIIEEKSYEEY